MKKLIAVCAASFMLAGTAFAEEARPAAPATPVAAPSQCAAAALPDALALPDGATANRAAVEAGNRSFTAWLTANRAAYECRKAEYFQALATFQARQAEFTPWNDRVRTVNEGWKNTVCDYNDAHPRDRLQFSEQFTCGGATR